MTMSRRDGFIDTAQEVRCGQCIGCRVERSRNWGIRCYHEASLHDFNMFVTLTYDDEHLPHAESLDRDDLTKFHKRLKKRVPNLRMFYCGEYGDETDRPHYHSIYFGWWPGDALYVGQINGVDTYRSEVLDRVWGKGKVEFSAPTFESMQYVAGYVTKKITGEKAKEHYQWTNESGEVFQRTPPFQGQSLKPGIGFEWIMRFMRDVYSKDQIVINGNVHPVPRYYDKMCEAHRPSLWRKVQQRRNSERLKQVKSERANARLPEPNRQMEYKRSDRHRLVADKIAKSRQKKRDLER